MKNSILRSRLIIILKGDNLKRFLNVCASNNISIFNIQMNDKKTIEATIYLDDLWKMPKILRKTKTKIRINQRKGFGFFFKRFINNKSCVFLCFLLALLIINYKIRIWDIYIKGSFKYSNSEIIELLDNNNISISCLKKNVDTNKLETVIKNNFDDIVWCDCYINNSSLFINIREAEYNSPKSVKEKSKPIIANKNSIVKSIILRSGYTDIKAGDVVCANDVLVDNYVPIEDDYGEITGYIKVIPDADIIGYVNYEVDIFQNKTIDNINNSNKSITLSDNKIKQIINDKLKAYEMKLKKNGVSILYKNVIMYKEKNGFRLSGQIYGYENLCN